MITKEHLERRLRVYADEASPEMQAEAETIRLALRGLEMTWRPSSEAPEGVPLLIAYESGDITIAHIDSFPDTARRRLVWMPLPPAPEAV